MAYVDGVRLKKKFGQNFLRDYDVLTKIMVAADLKSTDSVIEIGCGDGFLTQSILDSSIHRLWSFEIDQEWVQKTGARLAGDDRFRLLGQDILKVDINTLLPYAPWIVVANLPYNIIFPILELFKNNQHIFQKGVIMVQEEVAQKIVKKAGSGKDYGYISLFFQHFFEWRLLDKVYPHSFVPEPKVFSRLLYFEVKQSQSFIIDPEGFWQFIIVCFKQPRRTLRNNLAGTFYKIDFISKDVLDKRAQQLNFEELHELWKVVLKKCV